MKLKMLLLTVLLATLGVLVVHQSPSCAAPEVVTGSPEPIQPGGDKPPAPSLAIELVPVVRGIDQPTDIQAVPGHPGLLALLSKTGQARLAQLPSGKVQDWFAVEVNTDVEMGLLGLAFHPKYPSNGRFFVHYNPEDGQKTRIAEWQAPPDPRTGPAKEVRVLLEIAQPWANHNGGQIQFGRDGHLYIGMGDGGAADDPKGAGQNLQTLLGKMLRISVEPNEGMPYTIPPDNPFFADPKARSEIWAYGLRNPWRFSFLPDGRLIAGDVGQNLWEEITLVGRGENLGWNRREGNRCFPPGKTCKADGLVDPIHVYGREDGASVTGGYVYAGTEVPELIGKYVFGDYASGRLWALDLKTLPVPAEGVYALGTFPIYPATFGVGHDGTIYVGDFREGQILKIAKPKTAR